MADCQGSPISGQDAEGKVIMKYITYTKSDGCYNNTEVPVSENVLRDDFNDTVYSEAKLKELCRQFEAEDNDGTRYWVKDDGIYYDCKITRERFAELLTENGKDEDGGYLENVSDRYYRARTVEQFMFCVQVTRVNWFVGETGETDIYARAIKIREGSLNYHGHVAKEIYEMGEDQFARSDKERAKEVMNDYLRELHEEWVREEIDSGESTEEQMRAYYPDEVENIWRA